MLAKHILWGCFLLGISVRSWEGGNARIGLSCPWSPKSVLKAAIMDSHLWLSSAGKCFLKKFQCCCFVLNFFSTSFSSHKGRNQFFIYFFSFTPNIYAVWKNEKSHFDSVIWWFIRNRYLAIQMIKIYFSYIYLVFVYGSWLTAPQTLWFS